MKMKFVVVPILMGTLLSGIAAAYANMNSGSQSFTTVQATPKSDQNQLLTSTIKNADFIFQGVVTKVEYRLSDPLLKSASQLPYTFVTYKIEKLLQGQDQRQFVTLRFLGGPDGKDDILQVSDIPLFDVGDRDILFVSRNGKSICPLVECENGRFRLINNQVLNNLGKPLSLNQQGKLAFGKRVPLQEVLVNQVGSYKVEYEISDSREERLEQALPATTLNQKQFEDLIRQQAQRLAQSGQLRVQPIVSADIKTPLVAPLPKASSPPAAQPSLNEAKREQIERDRRQYPKNQPVLKQPR